MSKYLSRHITPGVKKLQEVVKDGGDPRTLHIGSDPKLKSGKSRQIMTSLRFGFHHLTSIQPFAIEHSSVEHC